MGLGTYFRVHCCRLVVAAFVLALTVAVAVRSPAGPLPASFQHTVHYHAAHGNQPCLDSPAFDWTLPRAAFSVALRVHATHQLHLNRTAYVRPRAELYLYNRPPPLT
jgi:hypothetical protein